MKFQNPSLNFFERTDERTDAHTDKPKAICSPFFQSWGHNYIIGEKGIFILESRYENPRFCIHAKQIVTDQLQVPATLREVPIYVKSLL